MGTWHLWQELKCCLGTNNKGKTGGKKSGGINLGLSDKKGHNETGLGPPP